MSTLSLSRSVPFQRRSVSDSLPERLVLRYSDWAFVTRAWSSSSSTCYVVLSLPICELFCATIALDSYLTRHVSATWGPKLGLRQMCQARYSFGCVVICITRVLDFDLVIQVFRRYYTCCLQFVFDDGFLYPQLYPWWANLVQYFRRPLELEVCYFVDCIADFLSEHLA